VNNGMIQRSGHNVSLQSTTAIALTMACLAASGCGAPRLPHPPAAAQPGQLIVPVARDLGASPGDEPVAILVGLRTRDAALQESDLQTLYDPRSPTFGHFLTPGEYNRAYGPDATTINGRTG